MPAPIELNGDEVSISVTEHYQPVHGLPVIGAAVSVKARYGDVTGRHTIQTVSTSDEAMCASREELGRPSILGTEVRIWAKGNTWWGIARRGPATLFRLSVFPERVVQPKSCNSGARPAP